MRASALQEFDRSPELMQRLVAAYGTPALEAGAWHPGVGPVLSKVGIGAEGFLARQPTDNVIRLGRIADDIGRHPTGQRAELLARIEKAPDKVFKLLEAHPNVLKTGAALTAFLAAKDQLLGTSEIVVGPDGKPSVLRKTGLIENVSAHVSAILEKPALITASAIGIVLLVGSLVSLRRVMKPKSQR